MDRAVWRKARSCIAVVAILVSGAVLAGTAGLESYTYDALGRLIRIDTPDGTRSSYEYDPGGNRKTAKTGQDAAAPSVPTGLSASAVSPTQVNLSWTASTDTGGSGLAGYKVYRGGSNIGSASSTTYSDLTAAGNTTYTYTVASYDNALNQSAQSSGASVTTPPGNITNSATLTQAISNTGGGTTRVTMRGYRSANPVLGSYSPTALTGGQTVTVFNDLWVCSWSPQPASCPAAPPVTITSQKAIIEITGFAANPGGSWLISATALGVTRSGAAASYSFSGVTATWQWDNGTFGLANSGAITVSIVHQ